MSRETILEYDAQRTAIELEINGILEYLNGPGMPGLHNPLVDSEGFPLPDIDLYRVREMRNRWHVLNTDYTEIMNKMEAELHSLHASAGPLADDEVA
jgi:26S proteasome non-ATPase regulatory subunit 9